MKGKNNLIFINALVFIIYLLIYISLAINHFVIMKLEVTKAWFGSSLILVIFALVFILTMKNKEVSEKALKVIGITFGVIIILSSVLFLIYIKYNKFNDCSIFLIYPPIYNIPVRVYNTDILNLEGIGANGRKKD